MAIAVGPTRAQLCKDTINSVLERHCVLREDFFGRFRTAGLIEARADAVKRLREIGLTVGAIAKIIRRHRTTVIYYLDEGTRERKMKALRLSRFKWMADDIKEVVLEIADAEGVNAGALVAAWIAERALYEVEARARALRTAA